jgi:hypothetical protein
VAAPALFLPLGKFVREYSAFSHTGSGQYTRTDEWEGFCGCAFSAIKGLAKTLGLIGKCNGVGRRGPAVDTRRSYYLAHRQDDFAEAPADARPLESYDILYAAPANDNSPTKAGLSARCWDLFRRLVAVHGSAG